jgi:hypothetical protein
VLLDEVAEDAADAVLWVGMIAVCGIGSPSGRRKSAVTANQSASPPTSDASAVARTKPSQGYVGSSMRATRKTSRASTRRPLATRFMRASCARRAASSITGAGVPGAASLTVPAGMVVVVASRGAPVRLNCSRVRKRCGARNFLRLSARVDITVEKEGLAVWKLKS